MSDNDLSSDEMKTLASFQAAEYPHHPDPIHFAKLLSMALVEQKEGGPVLTDAGRARLAAPRD